MITVPFMSTRGSFTAENGATEWWVDCDGHIDDDLHDVMMRWSKTSGIPIIVCWDGVRLKSETDAILFQVAFG